MRLFSALLLSMAAAVPFVTSPVAAQPVPTRTEVVASGLDHPWSLAFLPGGGVLVTERSGGLRRLEGGKSFAVSGVPKVFSSGQAGLFDVVPHPDFRDNGLIFLAYAHGTKEANGTRVARAKLVGNSLLDLTPIYTAAPLKRGNAHFGGRLLFLPDGTLLLSTGDGFDYREHAQKKSSPLGKVLRITTDGKVPADNPFVADPASLGAVWTLGHRNTQGLAWDPVRKLVFAHEHGPRGGDEVNILKAGVNYGWPVATFGMDYSGATISPYTEYKGMQQPLLHWTPSIAPSGMAVYRGAMFPEWQGDLFVGALAEKDVRRVDLDDAGKPIGQERLFGHLGERIRDVRVAPDGSIWLTTDSPQGKILRVTRAN